MTFPTYKNYSISDDQNGYAGTNWAGKVFTGEADEYHITNPLARRQYGQPRYHVFHKKEGVRQNNGCSVENFRTMNEALRFCHSNFLEVA